MYARDKKTKEIILIKANKFNPEYWEAVSFEKKDEKLEKKKKVVKKEQAVVTEIDQLPEKALRDLAKEKGISSWHVKSVERLRGEVKEANK